MGESDDRAAIAAANYAGQLQTRIGVEDEEIQMVQSKIASFRKVSDETARMSGVFDRATEAAFDLAAGGFGEASSNAVQLGKALQNPAIGAQALAKAGALNKSDIPLIKQIQATYGLGAAQEYVLKAVEKQVKGQAANTATSASKMKIAFGEVAETAGRVLLPTIAKTMASVGKAVDRFNAWSQANPKLTGTIVKVVGAAGALSLAISAGSFVFGGLLKAVSAVMWVKKAYIAVMATEKLAKINDLILTGRLRLMYLGDAAAKWASAAATTATTVATGIATAAQWLFNASLYGCPIVWIIAGVIAVIAIVVLLVKNWDKVSAFFTKLWDKIKGVFSAAWTWLKNLFLNYTPHGLIIKHWDKISGFFAGLWARVKGIFLGFVSWVGGLLKQFYDFGVNIIMGIWNGIKAKATALFDYVKDVGKKIAGAFKSVLGIASPSKVFTEFGLNITEGAKKGIEKGSPSVVGASAGMGKAAAPNFAMPSSSGSGFGSGVTVNFSPVISGGGASGDILEQLKKYTPQLIREIESVLDRKKRLAY